MDGKKKGGAGQKRHTHSHRHTRWYKISWSQLDGVREIQTKIPIMIAYSYTELEFSYWWKACHRFINMSIWHISASKEFNNNKCVHFLYNCSKFTNMFLFFLLEWGKWFCQIAQLMLLNDLSTADSIKWCEILTFLLLWNSLNSTDFIVYRLIATWMWGSNSVLWYPIYVCIHTAKCVNAIYAVCWANFHNISD